MILLYIRYIIHICFSRISKKKQQQLEQLKELQHLFQSGKITQDEYNQKKQTLIDEMTLTTYAQSSNQEDLPKPKMQVAKVPQEYAYILFTLCSQCRSSPPLIVNSPPPDFTNIPEERAVRHEYNYETQTWSRMPCIIKLAPDPFARGSLRLCYYMEVCFDSLLSNQ